MTIVKRLTIIGAAGVVIGCAILELPHTRVSKVSPMVAKVSLAEMTSKADVVVQGVISKNLGTFRQMGPAGDDMVYTKWLVTPEKFLKGKSQPITVLVLGGQYLTTSITVEDQPTFAVGDHVVLALTKFPGNSKYYRIEGEFQGAYTVSNANGALHQFLSNDAVTTQQVEQNIVNQSDTAVQ